MRKKEKPGLLKALFAGIGFAEKAHDTFSKMFDEMVDRGRLKSSDSDEYLKQVLLRARGEREDFDEIMKEILRDICRSVGLASRAEIEDLEMRLENYEAAMRESGIFGPAERKGGVDKGADGKGVEN